MHLVVDRARFPVPEAVVIAEGGRILFAIPWGERVILGTTDTDYRGDLANPPCDAADVAYVLEVVNATFPAVGLAAGDVVSTWSGLRPLVADPHGRPSDISRRHEIGMSHPGWWDVTGGKLTTYRLMAEEAVDAIGRFLGAPMQPCADGDRVAARCRRRGGCQRGAAARAVRDGGRADVPAGVAAAPRRPDGAAHKLAPLPSRPPGAGCRRRRLDGRHPGLGRGPQAGGDRRLPAAHGRTDFAGAAGGRIMKHRPTLVRPSAKVIARRPASRYFPGRRCGEVRCSVFHLRIDPPVTAISLDSHAHSNGKGPLIIGHRGASFNAPENTLAAFRLALAQGADGIEGDFRLSADGHVVCIHDPDTQRVAGVRHVVAETPLAVLRSLDVGSWKNEMWRGEQMPTLTEVAALMPRGKKMFIELKVGVEIVPALMAALDTSALALEQIVVISFDAEAIAECELRRPGLRTQWLTDYKQQDDGAWRPSEDTIMTMVQRAGADALGSKANRAVLDHSFLGRLSALDMREFGVWTVDDPELARYYIEHGAWSITTNRPAWLREQLGLNGSPSRSPG